jgi:hypothetical protein
MLRCLALLPPRGQLDGQQLPQQDPAPRLGLGRQEIFDPRPAARAPGRLMAVADQVDVIG